MDRRPKLDLELRELQIAALGYQNTYFEPTEEIRMKYDAVVYEYLQMNVKRANNKSYLVRPGYRVTVISRDPETPLPKLIQEHFERCAPERSFVRDNLHHFPFVIYY